MKTRVKVYTRTLKPREPIATWDMETSEALETCLALFELRKAFAKRYPVHTPERYLWVLENVGDRS